MNPQILHYLYARGWRRGASPFAGLAAFYDATNSNRKVWTTAILAGVGGVIGGYLIGRALDKTENATSQFFSPGGIRFRIPVSSRRSATSSFR